MYEFGIVSKYEHISAGKVHFNSCIINLFCMIIQFINVQIIILICTNQKRYKVLIPPDPFNLDEFGV